MSSSEEPKRLVAAHGEDSRTLAELAAALAAPWMWIEPAVIQSDFSVIEGRGKAFGRLVRALPSVSAELDEVRLFWPGHALHLVRTGSKTRWAWWGEEGQKVPKPLEKAADLMPGWEGKQEDVLLVDGSKWQRITAWQGRHCVAWRLMEVGT